VLLDPPHLRREVIPTLPGYTESYRFAPAGLGEGKATLEIHVRFDVQGNRPIELLECRVDKPQPSCTLRMLTRAGKYEFLSGMTFGYAWLQNWTDTRKKLINYIAKLLKHT